MSDVTIHLPLEHKPLILEKKNTLATDQL